MLLIVSILHVMIIKKRTVIFYLNIFENKKYKDV